MNMSVYSPDKTIAIYPFTRQADGEEIIIGIANTGTFLAVPPEAVELLDHLAGGKTIGEARDLYQQKYGETPNMEDFLSTMASNGIVKTPATFDNSINHIRAAAKPPLQKSYHFAGFPQQLAQKLFSRPALLACFLVIAVAGAMMIRDNSLAPRPVDLIFSDRRAMSLLILICISSAGLFLHEMGHLVAARAVGVNSRMGIGNRLWYLVAETDLTGLWTVPSRRRYLPLLAGILIDATSGAVVVLLLFACNRYWVNLSVFYVRLMKALILSYWLRIAWQFFLFIRTDIYFVIINLFNCRNLLKDTQDLFGNLIARICPWIQRVDQSAIPPQEKVKIYIYSALWMIGRLWAFTVLITVTLPVAFGYLRNLARVFGGGYSADPANFIDSLVLSAIFLVPLLIGLIMWIKNLLFSEKVWIWKTRT